MFPSSMVICHLNVIMTSGITMTMPNINLANGSGNFSGTISKSGGASPSTNGQGPLLTFNLFVDFFENCEEITKGFRQKKL